MFRIRRESNVHRLLADSTTWDSLAGGVPHRQTAWLGAWWDHFGHPERAYFVVARDDRDQVRGIMPMVRRDPNGALGGTLAFIGSGSACSDDQTILCKTEDSDAIGEQFADWLAAASAGGDDAWSALDLDGIRQGNPTVARFCRTMTEHGGTVHGHSRAHTWRRAVEGDWETFLAKAGSHAKRRFRGTVRKLESLDGLSFAVTATPEELKRDLDTLIELHQKRWQSVGQPGSYAAPKFRSFIHDTCQRFLSRGSLQLLNMRLRDRSIGMIAALIGDDGGVYGYSSAYDIDDAQLEPGRLLSVHELQRAHQDRRPFVDYMRGDETYKQRMLASPTRLIRLRVAAPRSVAKLRHKIWLAGFEAKQWIRQRRADSAPLYSGPDVHLAQPATAGDTATSPQDHELTTGPPHGSPEHAGPIPAKKNASKAKVPRNAPQRSASEPQCPAAAILPTQTLNPIDCAAADLSRMQESR
jgi:CelD/BcsL family acetyltransferase involved in cellulose biosynthesis